MRRIILCIIFILLTAAGCMKKPLDPVAIRIPDRKIDFVGEVKPILDARCVVCHSCYNSPCQLKLSSYEGVDRGATKKAVYASERLKTMDPTRLFIDAVTAEEWREKDFFSVTESSAAEGLNDSIMLQLLSHKMTNPKSVGEFFSEASDLTCSKDGSELSSYLAKHPNRGMPFGFPPLQEHEYEAIAGWLAQGAKGPNPEQQEELKRISKEDLGQIRKWEKFLNSADAKYVMTARYLYEHLFLAHIKFGTSSNSFFELVRSATPPGEPIIILPTVRPYDDPGGVFFYRFRKINTTIVHKTHMVFTFDDWLYTRVNELFIQSPWLEEPHVMGYGEVEGADPFITFEQIPPKAKYQFLLDNIHYIIMTFIRGPVCKGQVALNVINDHFWVLFLDPEADLAVRYPGFLRLHRKQLRMPAEKGSDSSLLRALTNPYHELAMDYFNARIRFYMAHHFNGIDYEAIWKGGRKTDAPILTVFRHFDSASVHRGALGDLPRTVWVMDYPLLERIYYSLVAGFDVFGTAGHQLTTRLYMDALRREGEGNFLQFLPQEKRNAIMKSWYQGMDFFFVRYAATAMPAKIEFKTDDPKREFMDYLLREYFPKEMELGPDPVNYRYGADMEIPKTISTSEDVMNALHAVSSSRDTFFNRVTDHNVNLGYIRVRMSNSEDMVITVVINRWHDNVTFLFGEKRAFDPSKDSADFFEGFLGSYPNYFFDLELADVGDFARLLKNYRGSDEDISQLRKYGINRNDERFWEVYDWFQNRFDESDQIQAGLFDLNRYFYRGVE